MDKEIRFRAWSSKTQQWVTDKETVYVSDVGHAFTLSESPTGDVLNREYLKLNIYVGVRDKNGKEIFEGDIIEFPDGYNDDEEFVSVGLVEWDDSELCFYATNRQTVSCEQLWNNSDDIEVLGNIYENPDLLINKNEIFT